jgi:hypothetical protein
MTPLITIGIPAYNADSHIALTLDSLLAQSFGDFELVISDNASTDGTRDVVEAYRLRDSRIHYVRQPANLGANLNYSFVAQKARGALFKWASSSDWCAPTFLERCKDELAAHPDAVLTVPRTRLFSGDLSCWQASPDDFAVLDPTPSGRLAEVYSLMGLNNAINGVIRTSALRRTRLIEPYRGADMVLMGHLALLGKFRLVEEPLFYRRMEPETATALQDPAAMLRHHYPQLSARALFQGCKKGLGRLHAAFAAPMPAGERARSLLYVARTWYWERAALVDDLRIAWAYLASSLGGAQR